MRSSTCPAVGGVGAVVREVNLDARPAAYLQRFWNAAAAISPVGVHVAQVRRIDAAVLGDHLADGDQFIRVAPGVGMIGHSCGEAYRALLHALPNHVQRLVQRVAAQRNVLEPDRLQAYRPVRYVVGGVYRDLLVVVGAERPPRWTYPGLPGGSPSMPGQIAAVCLGSSPPTSARSSGRPARVSRSLCPAAGRWRAGDPTAERRPSARACL